MNKNRIVKSILGFTLAEVLITLGIIGVIAAITIPTLVSNYQKTQYVVMLKKFYSTFTSGMKLYMANNNCEDMACTKLFEGRTIDEAWQTRFTTEYPKIFKVVKLYNSDNYLSDYPKTKDLNGTGESTLFGSWASTASVDGFFVSILDNFNDNCGQYPTSTSKLKNFCSDTIVVDLNGTKGPNTQGRDVYQFLLGNDGLLYPMFGSEHGKLAGAPDAIWKLDPSFCGVAGNPVIPSGTSGSGCAARIMENSWQMDY